MRINVDLARDIPPAYSLYYSAMANHFARLIGTGHAGLVLEAGCGRGQLTIPLLSRLPRRSRLVAVDSSKGPYRGWAGDLQLRLKEAGLADRVRLLEADTRKMKGVASQSMNVLVSNELLCDLTSRRQLIDALREFRRVLLPDGLMVHGEWASFSTDGSRSFAIKHSPSWNPDQLFLATRSLGFHDFHITYFDTTISFGQDAALAELESWGASRTWLRRNHRKLREQGIQLPAEHVVVCRK